MMKGKASTRHTLCCHSFQDPSQPWDSTGKAGQCLQQDLSPRNSLMV